MRDFIEYFWPVFAFVAIGLAVVYQLDKHDCRVYSRTTGLETRYEFGTCYVKQGDRFYPRSELQLRNATKGE